MRIDQMSLRRRRSRAQMIPGSLETLETRLVLSSFFVSNAGNDSAAGTAAAPWKTLQHAADTVQPGDVVDVRAGTYKGMDLWTSGTAAAPIIFHAEPGTVVNTPNQRTADGINLEGASYITIEGFNVINQPRTAIRAVVDNHVIIQNNVMDHNGYWGILTGFSDDILIQNNVASNSVQQHGIYVSDSSHRPTVINNTLFGNAGCGLQLNAGVGDGGDGIINGALIANNTIYNNGTAGGAAINLDGVIQSTIKNNLLYNNHAGGLVMYVWNGALPSTDNIAVNNTIVMPSDGRWAINISANSVRNTLLNNIITSANSARGSIEITSDSLAGFVSDYNTGTGGYTINDASKLTLANWAATTGQDTHSTINSPTALFANFAGNDYHLSATSPAIDAGTSLKAPLTDIAGNPRPSGKGFDIGTYEYQSAPTQVAKVQVLDGTTDILAGTSTASFGTTLQGTPVSKTFTVVDQGTAPLTLGSITLPTGFTLVSGFGSTTLAAGASTTFVVQMTAGTKGTYSGPISFTTNDPSHTTVQFTLNGTVTAPAVQILDGTTDILAGTSTISFGTAVQGFPVTKTLTIKDTGTASLSLGTLSLPTGFSLVSGFGSTTLAPGATTTIVVQMTASAVGSYSGVLSFGTNDPNRPTVQITLSGTVTPSTVYLDDATSAFTTSGAWRVSSTAGYYGASNWLHFSQTTLIGDPNPRTATWSTAVSPGIYKVSIDWKASTSFSTDVPFTVRDGSTALGTTTINESLAPVGFTDAGVTWQDLGTFTISSGKLSVLLTAVSSKPGKFAVADAVRIQRVG